MPQADLRPPEESGHAPPTDWLKNFFSEGDSLFDAYHSLCLSCHTIWCEDTDDLSDTPRWFSIGFERFAKTSDWQRGMSNAHPGGDILNNRDNLVRRIRGLSDPRSSYGMV